MGRLLLKVGNDCFAVALNEVRLAIVSCIIMSMMASIEENMLMHDGIVEQSISYEKDSISLCFK